MNPQKNTILFAVIDSASPKLLAQFSLTDLDKAKEVYKTSSILARVDYRHHLLDEIKKPMAAFIARLPDGLEFVPEPTIEFGDPTILIFPKFKNAELLTKNQTYIDYADCYDIENTIWPEDDEEATDGCILVRVGALGTSDIDSLLDFRKKGNPFAEYAAYLRGLLS